MKRSGSGRIARKIGAYDDDSAESPSSSQSETQNRSDNIVKRPVFTKSKKRSSLRVSFGAGESEGNDADESSDSAVITPKKSNLSRMAIEKNAQLKARSPLVPGTPRTDAEERPTYSKDYIAELRNSTPSTPKDLKPSAEEEEETKALDIASKFGAVAPRPVETSSAIPTEAEILEKKARRKRLAKEQAASEDGDNPWASDDDGEDEFRTSRNEISLRPKEKYAETRLVHDDEDIAEGFDDFVDDGRIALGKKSEREAQRKRRAEIAELIQGAERGSDDDSTDDSEEERNAEFAEAQARAGRYGDRAKGEEEGTKTPPRITPLPDLGDILSRLQADVEAKEQRKELVMKKLEELQEDRVRIENRKKYLQEQLQKTGKEYEKLRLESGAPALPANETEGGRLITERGLDSLGTTPVGPRSSGDSDSE